MKSIYTSITALSAAFFLALTLSSGGVQGGSILSHFAYPARNDPNHHLDPNHNPAGASMVSHLEWNSQIGNTQQSRQGSDRGQFQPYANFALQAEQQQPQFGTVTAENNIASGSGGGPGCRTRDRVYLPDMQSFLIKSPLTYQEALQACVACGSELALVDGTNVDRFREAFSSLGLFSDQRLWIKSWFGEQVQSQGACPAVLVNGLMGNRLESTQDDCQARFYALCY